MLKIDKLSVTFGHQPVLKDISLQIRPGETLAVVGESGAGKTTLGLSVLGLTAGVRTGSIRLDENELVGRGEEEMRTLRGREIAIVLQSGDEVLHPLFTALDQVAEAVIVHFPVARDAARARASRILTEMGLDEKRQHFHPHRLSGGERQRALLAMALVNEPRLVVLDEPTAALDPRSKAEVCALLKARLAGKAALLITHDLGAAAAVANMVAVLYSGSIVEWGPCREVFAAPRHPYTRALLRAYPDMGSLKDLQRIPGRTVRNAPGCPYHPRCTQDLPVCEKLVPELKPNEADDRVVACHRGGIIPCLEVTGLSKSFDGNPVIADIDLTLFEGETLALVGESGSGKTTLARTLMGLWAAEAGQVVLEGKTGIPRKQFYEYIQMVFQNPGEMLSHRLTVREIVREPLDVHNRGTAAEREALVLKTLAEVELPVEEDFLGRYPHQISGGEAQRVAIARSLVLAPKVLIADEITSALDAGAQASVVRLLLELQERRGLALLFITHDLALARKVSDRVAVLQQGRIIETGQSGKVLTLPEHSYTRALLDAVPSIHF
ncbi:MAG TPA: ABC transporter ATP-binding protein [Negativicutes bacterium]|nr:ABC transporter ATP-binding protein [Negativicutes bacterium]